MAKDTWNDEASVHVSVEVIPLYRVEVVLDLTPSRVPCISARPGRQQGGIWQSDSCEVLFLKLQSQLIDLIPCLPWLQYCSTIAS